MKEKRVYLLVYSTKLGVIYNAPRRANLEKVYLSFCYDAFCFALALI